MLPFRLVYHEEYDLHLGSHVFPSKKYRWLHDRLIRTKFATAEDFAAPEPAADEDILLVHDPQWVSKLRSGTLTYQDILRLEIPYSRQMVEAFWLAAGGPILAGRAALASGAPWWWIAMFTTAMAPRRFSPATIRCSRSRFTSSRIIRPRSLPRAWTFTWRTGLAMRSISTGWGTGTARRWRCSSRSWLCTSRARIHFMRISWADCRSRLRGWRSG